MIHNGIVEKEPNLKWDNSLIKADDHPKQRLNSSGNQKRQNKRSIISPQGMVSLNNIQDIMPQILNEESNKSRSNSNVYYYKFNKLVKVNSALDSNNDSIQK
jgi:hypothetical protein